MSDAISVQGSFTGDLILRALDAAAMRHTALAANIANASVPGYRPLRISFEDQLLAARSALLDRDGTVARRALAPVQPRVEVSTQTALKLDEEFALLAQNSLRYQALVTALNNGGSLLKLAIREGRA
jgi:flagellar basal-body rod protein FlgB